MERLKRVIFCFLIISSSCTGSVDAGHDGLWISADKTEIDADGIDAVTFTVMYDGRDVSDESSCSLIRICDGDKKQLRGGENKFSVNTAGTYVISARYWDSEAVYSRNQVEVEARHVGQVKIQDYHPGLLAVYFTSTGCSGCPAASSALAQIADSDPDAVCILAFHTDMASVLDPMKISQTSVFINALGGFATLPHLFWNMDPDFECTGGLSISDSYSGALAKASDDLGVRLTTSYDGTTRELDVEVGVMTNIGRKCRYIVFLVEDGLSGYDQMGTEDSDYIHNNVVRAVSSASAFGDKFNDGIPLYPGAESLETWSTVISDDWDAGHMRVVAAVLCQNEDSNWIIVNHNKCAVGETIGYILKD